MFRRADRTTTERRQLLDSTTEDEEIETKIKEGQRENGRCMVSTSRRLQIIQKFVDGVIESLEPLNNEKLILERFQNHTHKLEPFKV